MLVVELSERTDMQQTSIDTDRQGRRRNMLRSDRQRRHEEAVIQAEVKRLVHTISPYGILRRDFLARSSGAEHWPGGFERALQAAVEQGRLEARPFGFYRRVRPDRGATKPSRKP